MFLLLAREREREMWRFGERESTISRLETLGGAETKEPERKQEKVNFSPPLFTPQNSKKKNLIFSFFFDYLS